jgi:hypothetical protein
MEIQSYFKVRSFDSLNKGSILDGAFGLSEALDWDEVDVAFLLVNENRYDNNEQLFADLDGLQHQLLHELDQLYSYGASTKIAWLGEFVNGETLADTESGLAEVIAHLITKKVVPVIICIDKRTTVAAYKAYERLEQITNITAIDAYLNIDDNKGGYVGRIIKSQPNFLFNYANIGFQTYLVNPEELELSEQLYFEASRLGLIRGAIQSAEPYLRGAEIITCSMSSIKSADFKSSQSPQPNGIFAEEVCQLMRYAGLTALNQVLLITDLLPSKVLDSEVDGKLLAEMIWCFLDGFPYRKPEQPGLKKEGFLKYRVPLKDDEFQLVFYKSLNTDRWWMEVPVPPQYANKYRKHHMVPCDYNDYMIATNDDLPERWWKAYKKML